MTAKLPVIKHSGIGRVYYYWLPPLLLTAGVLFMAGDLGSVPKFRFPMIILKIFLPTLSHHELLELYLKLRKIGHFFIYAALFATYVRAWRWHLRLSRLKAVFLALVICFLVSAADEGRQLFYPSRGASFRDIALDMSGALTATVVFFPFLKTPD